MKRLHYQDTAFCVKIRSPGHCPIRYSINVPYCHVIAKCWRSSACRCEVVPNISLQPAGSLPSIESNSQKMSDAPKAVVLKVRDLILHYTLFEIVHLWMTKIFKCLTFHFSSSRGCVTFWLKYAYSCDRNYFFRLQFVLAVFCFRRSLARC